MNHVCITWSYDTNMKKLLQPNNEKNFFSLQTSLLTSSSTSSSTFMLGKLRFLAGICSSYFTLNTAYGYIFLFFKVFFSNSFEKNLFNQ